MQVGTKGPANLIVSTVIEAENLVPWVAECQSQGREASVSYSTYQFLFSASNPSPHLSDSLVPLLWVGGVGSGIIQSYH